jgi:hypothetical protein
MHDVVAKVQRLHFSLTKQELSDFRKLRPVEGEAIDFWGKVAISRGLDPKTIISDRKGFSGLPEGHGKHWCFPSKLRCSRRFEYTGFVPDLSY